MPLDELSANNRVGSDYFDQTGMIAFDWPSEVEPGDDVSPSLSNNTVQEVVVTGKRNPTTGVITWSSSGPGIEQPSPIGGDTSTIEPDNSEPTDEEVVEITIKFNPTDDQKAIVKAVQDAIDRAEKAIRGLADNERVRLTDGSFVTGKHLKELWAKIDFVINPEGTTYPNGTDRGEANYYTNVISYNINVVADYAALGAAAMNHFVLHELGHFTAANRAFDENPLNPQNLVEQVANDIARAIAHEARIDTLPATGWQRPTSGYGTEDPLIFEVPAP